jgi:hypothetical protein
MMPFLQSLAALLDDGRPRLPVAQMPPAGDAAGATGASAAPLQDTGMSAPQRSGKQSNSSANLL